MRSEAGGQLGCLSRSSRARCSAAVIAHLLERIPADDDTHNFAAAQLLPPFLEVELSALLQPSLTRLKSVIAPVEPDWRVGSDVAETFFPAAQSASAEVRWAYRVR